MMRFLYLTIALIFLVAVDMPASEERRNESSIKREQANTRQQIKETAKKLDDNTIKVQNELNQLNLVTAEIKVFNREIALIQQKIDSLTIIEKNISDSIAEIDRQLLTMLRKYAAAIKKMQTRQGDMNTLSFIMSADNFSQAFRRMRYLRQFSQWRARKSEEIKNMQQCLNMRKQKIKTLQASISAELHNINISRNNLQERSNESIRLVENLKKESKTLKRVLAQKEKEAQALDDELERLIKEQRLAEEKRRKEEELRLAEEKRRQKEAEEKRIAEELRKRKADSLAKLTIPENKPPQQEKESAPKTEEQQKETNPPAKNITKFNDAELTAGFLNAKGSLISPVNGKYTIVKAFGIQQHPTLKYIKTQNSGIDIETDPGCSVRTVYNGVVSAIFRQPGYNNIVMVRHGNYISIYTNIDRISVKKGDTVTTGQTLGTLLVNENDNNRSILHFEIRNETEKLNPAEWLKK